MLVIRMIALVWLFAGAAAYAQSPKANWDYAEKKLRRAGLRGAFIQNLKRTYEPTDFKSVVELNTLLFLRKADYHGPQVSKDAVESVKNFVNQNRATFDAAESRYGVSPSVIAGLLWMESRYGDNQGRFHVTSAFVDLVQADRPAVLKYLRAQAVPRFADKLSAKNRRAIAAKAKQKSKWAIEELKALQKMYARDAALVKNLRGSFAGAFGMPQFEPSSYVSYARAAGPDAPDLTKASDAIYSVAHYLKASGWRKGKLTTYEKALLQYNHSHDYARAILRLAWEADGLDPSRIPASTKYKRIKKKRRHLKRQ